MEFYRCFICEVTLKDEKDFQDHLKQLSHLCSLEARKLISSEHVDMLILIDKFKLGSRQRQICEGAEKMPKISNQQSRQQDIASDSLEEHQEVVLKSQSSASIISNANNTPLPSNAIQDSTADIFVLSIKCILCCQSISSFTEFKQHLTEASTHTQLKGKNSPLLKIMKCEDCNLEFGETELCVHLIIVHFNIASAHLCSIAEGNRNFECIPCGTRIGTIKTDHLESPKHIRKLSSSLMEYYMRCMLCHELFNSVSIFKQHWESKPHKTREEALRFYYKWSGMTKTQ